MSATEWLIVVALGVLAVWVVAGAFDARTARQPLPHIAQPVQAHTPLPPPPRQMTVSWARTGQVPVGPGRHRKPEEPDDASRTRG